MMNFWMVIAYELVSVADEYWFGFIVDHVVYLVKDIPFTTLARFFKKDRASSKRGGFQKIRIKATADELRELIPMAVRMGDESILENKNKGTALEDLLKVQIPEATWSKDSTPFWVAGDMQLNGKEIQIKLNGAELTNEKVFQNNFPELLPR
jgi:hypothetical protein